MTIEERVFEVLEATHQNYTVQEVPLRPVTPGYQIPQSKGIYRSDNKKWLGTVGAKYSTMQNHELVEITLKALDSIGKGGDTFIKGGTINGGARTYLQLGVPEAVVGRDVVQRYVTALNSHDGTTGVGFGVSNTVMSCQNQFYSMMKTLKKTRHSGSVVDRVHIMAENLMSVYAQEEKMIGTFRKMTGQMLTPKTVQGLITELFGVDPNDKEEDLSTRKQNQIQAFSRDVLKETSEKGKTVWGLFNAVTYYTNHTTILKRGTDRTQYLLAGTGNNFNQKAYDHLKKELVMELN